MKIEMNNLEALEQLSEVQKAQQMEMEPPKLEKVEMPEKSAENPPKLARSVSFGESRDVFNARKAFEASTNRIEAENRAKDLKEAIEEDARKKEEYREKLYGK